jgi:hypothetical protein
MTAANYSNPFEVVAYESLVGPVTNLAKWVVDRTDTLPPSAKLSLNTDTTICTLFSNGSCWAYNSSGQVCRMKLTGNL